MLTTIVTSSLLLVITLLILPILTTLSPHPVPPHWATSQVKTAVKLAFFVSLAPLVIFLISPFFLKKHKFFGRLNPPYPPNLLGTLWFLQTPPETEKALKVYKV